MKKISGEKMAELISKYSLQPSLERDISLLGYSTVIAGYKHLLQLMGFTYKAFGVILFADRCCSMAGPKDMTRKVQRLLSERLGQIDKILTAAMAIFKESSKNFEAVKNKKFSATDLADFLEIYEKYYGGLGVYNAFYRAIVDDNLGMPANLEKRIGRERNQVAELFPKMEAFLKTAVKAVGIELGIDGSLILNSVLSEAQDYLRSGRLTSAMISEMRQRLGHCYYLYTFKTGVEYIARDKTGIEFIYNKFFTVKKMAIHLIRGRSAYSGKVSGRVKVILPTHNLAQSIFNQGDIMVAVHTNPQFLPIIKSAAAIVTDEGGLLSHAAILAREFKIPCIIGTKIATKVLRDGDLVEVDADKGIVRRLTDKRK